MPTDCGIAESGQTLSSGHGMAPLPPGPASAARPAPCNRPRRALLPTAAARIETSASCAAVPPISPDRQVSHCRSPLDLRIALARTLFSYLPVLLFPPVGHP